MMATLKTLRLTLLLGLILTAQGLWAGKAKRLAVLLNVNRPCRVQWIPGKASLSTARVHHLNGGPGQRLDLRHDVVLANPGYEKSYSLRRLVFTGGAFEGDLIFMFQNGQIHYGCHLVGDPGKGTFAASKGTLTGADPATVQFTADTSLKQPLLQVQFNP